MTLSLAIPLPTLSAGLDPAVRTEVYEGPLDLLLYLVRREGIDLRQLSLSRICDDYLLWLEQQSNLDLDTVGDYLLLAALLCQLKARELLPRPERVELEEEAEDPRERLLHRLLDYERFREAALFLEGQARLDRDVFTRPTLDLPIEEQPLLAGTDALGLLKLYWQVMGQHQNPHSHAIGRESLSVTAQLCWLLERLPIGQERSLEPLLAELPERSQKIFCVLVVLEMCRLHYLEIRQSGHLGNIYLQARVSLEQVDLSALPAEAVLEEAEEDAWNP